MQMTILAQDATNSIAQLVKIVFKILAPHLRNWAKRFLDNARVKRSKTTYNNEKLAFGIRQYKVENI